MTKRDKILEHYNEWASHRTTVKDIAKECNSSSKYVNSVMNDYRENLENSIIKLSQGEDAPKFWNPEDEVRLSFDELKDKILKNKAKSEYKQASIIILRNIFEENEA